mmetsp:Transcript_11456/g.20577  ORF Transcript_11456/g.20577 Transcript_11456/m.20577 type:complete len:96 (+) Transcript_11456:3-290(+)
MIETLYVNLKSVVDYGKVAQDVAKYNKQSFERWINNTANWKQALADHHLRWHASWEAAGTKQATQAIQDWLSQPAMVRPCRKEHIWPPHWLAKQE